ncbi:hypothetical protein OIU79_016382 [Salix purpurea]|uniref:Thioglucosidase n=1 Tax=Salix purpurea TaxID=77065 RepID=A0A9Q0PEF9_SALPP|nr:hypothetical protein OIU79_016382 [Salix purpurea]
MNLEAKRVSGRETRYFCDWEAKPLQLRMLKLSFLLIILLISSVASPVFSADRYRREDFPPGFIFGAGSSAYQVEGAAYEDGRSSSIWDAFAHEGNEHGDTGDVAIDEYHKYKVAECDNAFNRQLVLCSCNFRSLRRSHFFWARIVSL